MSLLTRLESVLEAIFEGSTRRLFRPQLQPIEISHALEHAMTEERVVSADRLDVPNRYRARISATDYRRLEPLKATIERDAAAYLERRAHEQQLRPIGPIQVELVSDEAVPRSFVRTAAVFDERPSSAAALDRTRRMDPLPVQETAATRLLLVTEDGRELRVGEQAVKLGRARDNDFVIEDVRVSRHHAVIEPDGSGWIVRDLQSTNGTFVKGRRVEELLIREPTEISLGGCRLTPRAG